MELAGNARKEILPFLNYSKEKAIFLFCTQTATIQLLTFIHILIPKTLPKRGKQMAFINCILFLAPWGPRQITGMIKFQWAYKFNQIYLEGFH